MGYFKWYWGKHGFIKAIRSFFGVRFVNSLFYTVFNMVGSAIGAFFLKKLVLSNYSIGQYC